MTSPPSTYRLRPAATEYLDALARHYGESRRAVIERLLVKSRPPADCSGCVTAHERLAQIHGALAVIAGDVKPLREQLVDLGMLAEARASVALDGDTQSLEPSIEDKVRANIKRTPDGSKR